MSSILTSFERQEDRRRAHEGCRPILTEMARDQAFIHDVIRHNLSNPQFLGDTAQPVMSIIARGDLRLDVNLFTTLAEKRTDLASDHIHHHGYLMLSTIPLLGPGYESILFKSGFVVDKWTLEANLTIDREFRHVGETVEFIDVYTPHVVFHPPELTATLALWSADRPRLAQGMKRRLAPIRSIVRPALRLIRALRLDKLMGMNSESAPYFHPRDGRIFLMKGYQLRAGEREDILNTIFLFVQRAGFKDWDFLRSIAAGAPPLAQNLIARLIDGETLVDQGVRGDPNVRVTRSEIRAALGVGARS